MNWTAAPHCTASLPLSWSHSHFSPGFSLASVSSGFTVYRLHHNHLDCRRLELIRQPAYATSYLLLKCCDCVAPCLVTQLKKNGFFPCRSATGRLLENKRMIVRRHDSSLKPTCCWNPANKPEREADLCFAFYLAGVAQRARSLYEDMKGFLSQSVFMTRF